MVALEFGPNSSYIDATLKALADKLDPQEVKVSGDPTDAVGKIKIAPDNMCAYLNITEPQNGGKPLTAEQIRELAVNAGVKHGLRELAVAQLAVRPIYHRDMPIAEGTPPVKGKDGTLNYLVRLTKDAAPTEREDGSVDYKDLGLVENVVKDQPLCVKTPPDPGQAGRTITGQELPSLPGKDVPFPVGKNTYLSEDKLELRASINGQCDFVERRLVVMETFFVKGDVSSKTGNITFVGNVEIMGSVLTGFSVKAGGSININGGVEGASLTAGGNITIRDGFMGMNKGEITAGGSLRCKYIQGGRVSAIGVIETQTIVSAEVRSSDSVILPGMRSIIMGGRVTAKNRIDCQRIGNPNNPVRTIVEAGSDPTLLTRSNEIKKEIAQLTKNINGLDNILVMCTRLKEQNRLNEEKREIMEKASHTHRTASETLAALKDEDEDVKLRLALEGYGTITGRTAIYPEVRVIIGGEQQDIQITHQAVSFTRGDDGLQMSPCV